MTLGERIIDEIIKGGLCHASCAEDKEHGVLIVWSSGAAEQIEAVVEDVQRREKEGGVG